VLSGRAERDHNRCSKPVDVDSGLFINVFSNVTDSIVFLILRLTIFYLFLVYGMLILCSFSHNVSEYISLTRREKE